MKRTLDQLIERAKRSHLEVCEFPHSETIRHGGYPAVPYCHQLRKAGTDEIDCPYIGDVFREGYRFCKNSGHEAVEYVRRLEVETSDEGQYNLRLEK